MNTTILSKGGVSPPQSHLAATPSLHAVSQQAAAWLMGNAYPICGMTLAVLLVFLVVVPAVWSHQTERREAAFRVLDRILRIPRRRLPEAFLAACLPRPGRQKLGEQTLGAPRAPSGH